MLVGPRGFLAVKWWIEVPFWYRRDGTPYPDNDDGLMQAERDLGDIKKRIVARDELPNGVIVSTVWLVLNHGYGSGRPLIFETMLFIQSKRKMHAIGEQWRYSTEEEAKLGHKMLVKKWRQFKSADQVLAELKIKGDSNG